MSGLAIFFNALYTVDPQKEYLIICNAIQDADTIYVVEKGKIIESGTHVELLQLKGAYYDSVNN